MVCADIMLGAMELMVKVKEDLYIAKHLANNSQ
jgi:hypothetical protein